MDEKLGYFKCDFQNKETGNCRKGYNTKTMHTSYGNMELYIPSDRSGEFVPEIVKKYHNILIQNMEENNHISNKVILLNQL